MLPDELDELLLEEELEDELDELDELLEDEELLLELLLELLEAEELEDELDDDDELLDEEAFPPSSSPLPPQAARIRTKVTKIDLI